MFVCIFVIKRCLSVSNTNSEKVCLTNGPAVAVVLSLPLPQRQAGSGPPPAAAVAAVVVVAAAAAVGDYHNHGLASHALWSCVD